MSSPCRSSRRDTLQSSRTKSKNTMKYFGPEVKGKRVSVLFDNSKWYGGVIRDWSAIDDHHLVTYDDGETKWHSLADDEAAGVLRWEEDTSVPAKASTSSSKSRYFDPSGDENHAVKKAKSAASATKEALVPVKREKHERKADKAAQSLPSGRKRARTPPAAAAAALTTPLQMGGASLVGLHIEVHWPLDDEWYVAQVLRFDAETVRHTVEYIADGLEEHLTLSTEVWRPASESAVEAAKAAVAAAEATGADATSSAATAPAVASKAAAGKAAVGEAAAGKAAVGKVAAGKAAAGKAAVGKAAAEAAGAEATPCRSARLNDWPPLLARAAAVPPSAAAGVTTATGATGAGVAGALGVPDSVAIDALGAACAMLFGSDVTCGRAASSTLLRLISSGVGSAGGAHESGSEDDSDAEADAAGGRGRGEDDEAECVDALPVKLGALASLLRQQQRQQGGMMLGAIWHHALQPHRPAAEHLSALAALRAACGVLEELPGKGGLDGKAGRKGGSGGGGGHADAAAVLTALVDASASPAPPDAPRAERALNLLRAIAPKLQTLDPRALRSLATDEALARSVAGATVCERIPARAVAAALLVALAPAATPPLARTLHGGSSERSASTSAAATTAGCPMGVRAEGDFAVGSAVLGCDGAAAAALAASSLGRALQATWTEALGAPAFEERFLESLAADSPLHVAVLGALLGVASASELARGKGASKGDAADGTSSDCLPQSFAQLVGWLQPPSRAHGAAAAARTASIVRLQTAFLRSSLGPILQYAHAVQAVPMAAGKAVASNAEVKAAAEEVKAAAVVAEAARVLARLAETHAGAGTGAGLLLAASLLEEALRDVAAVKSNADAATVPAAAAAQVAEPTPPPPLPAAEPAPPPQPLPVPAAAAAAPAAPDAPATLAVASPTELAELATGPALALDGELLAREVTRALDRLGSHVTLKVLRLDLEATLKQPLLSWKDVIKDVATKYAVMLFSSSESQSQ
eukprot:jgi/Chrpa1/23311/Chrysochromulina_OHIO_Genome00008347-RA